MRKGADGETIAAMKWIRSNKPRPRGGATAMELMGALSVASQMALLYPPGCDEWIRREMAGDRAGLVRPDRRARSGPGP
jgi:hypothetical protein